MAPPVLAFRAGPLHLVVKTCLLYSSVVLKHYSILMICASPTRSTNQANGQKHPIHDAFQRSNDSSAKALCYLYTEAFCESLKGYSNQPFHSKTCFLECCFAFVSIINQKLECYGFCRHSIQDFLLPPVSFQWKDDSIF